MASADEHYKAIEEGVMRAKFIRQDLAKTLTEYDPEKVRGLNKAYIETIRQVINHGEIFLDKTVDLELGLKVGVIIENYRAFLNTLNQ